MGEDYRSCLPWQHFDWKPPDLNSLNPQLYPGQQTSISTCMNPCTNMVAKTGNLPGFAFPELPQALAGQANEPHGWFYGFPRYRKAFLPTTNSVFKEKLLTEPYDSCKQVFTPNVGSGLTQRGFLVFDQSGDQTTLVFRSGIGAPMLCPTSRAYNWTGLDDQMPTKDALDNSGPILTDEINDKHVTDAQSEMHEDTEELNALLYSDDSDSDSTGDCDIDDEVTSTGHSPSKMAAKYKQDWLEGIMEEVASSDGGLTKRQKLSYGGYNVPSTADTASSVKNITSDYEDDAESSCADAKCRSSRELGSLSGKKRTRKEIILETVSTLQSLIPGGNDKDAIGVLDEAILVINSLRLKAKVLGLDSL